MNLEVDHLGNHPAADAQQLLPEDVVQQQLLHELDACAWSFAERWVRGRSDAELSMLQKLLPAGRLPVVFRPNPRATVCTSCRFKATCPAMPEDVCDRPDASCGQF